MKDKLGPDAELNASPADELDEAWLVDQLTAARGFHHLGMLDEAEAALQLPPGAPGQWRARVQAGLGLIAWTRGDMQRVVDLCYPWQHLAPQPQIWFAMVATALKNCGRIPEAIALQQRGMALNGTGPQDCYNLACFHTQTGDYQKALSILHKGLLWTGFDRGKALIDSDLQPLWQRLPELSTIPKMRAILQSPRIAGLAKFPFIIAKQPSWDPPDCQNLPAAFGQYLISPPGYSLFHMNPAAPERAKHNFKQWILNRVHANQRLIRRGAGGWSQ